MQRGPLNPLKGTPTPYYIKKVEGHGTRPYRIRNYHVHFGVNWTKKGNLPYFYNGVALRKAECLQLQVKQGSVT